MKDDLAAAEANKPITALIMWAVQLSHPILFNTYNMYDIHRAGKIRQLGVAMLRAT